MSPARGWGRVTALLALGLTTAAAAGPSAHSWHDELAEADAQYGQMGPDGLRLNQRPALRELETQLIAMARAQAEKATVDAELADLERAATPARGALAAWERRCPSLAARVASATGEVDEVVALLDRGTGHEAAFSAGWQAWKHTLQQWRASALGSCDGSSFDPSEGDVPVFDELDQRLGDIDARRAPSGSAASLTLLVAARRAEYDARRSLRHERQLTADDVKALSWQEPEIATLEDEQARLADLVLDLRARIRRLRDQASDAAPTPEERALQGLEARYGGLYLRMDGLSEPLGHEEVCRVSVRGMILRANLGDLEGAREFAWSARAAQGTHGICDVQEVQAHPVALSVWRAIDNAADVLERGHVTIELGRGMWTLDGTRVTGSSTVTYPVIPGRHVVGVKTGQRWSHRAFRLPAAATLGVREDSGQVLVGPDAAAPVRDVVEPADLIAISINEVLEGHDMVREAERARQRTIARSSLLGAGTGAVGGSVALFALARHQHLMANQLLDPTARLQATRTSQAYLMAGSVSVVTGLILGGSGLGLRTSSESDR